MTPAVNIPQQAEEAAEFIRLHQREFPGYSFLVGIPPYSLSVYESALEAGFPCPVFVEWDLPAGYVQIYGSKRYEDSGSGGASSG